MVVLLMVVVAFCPSQYSHFDLSQYALLDHTASPMVKIGVEVSEKEEWSGL